MDAVKFPIMKFPLLLAILSNVAAWTSSWIISGSCRSSSRSALFAAKIDLNPLLKDIQPSKTVQVFSQVKELEAAGETITSLCVGEPDFGPPENVGLAVNDAIANGDTRYTAVTGTNDLRKAICKDLKRRKGISYESTQVVVANGAKQAVYQGLLALAGQGDAVIVPAPYWPSYPEQVRLCGASPILLETKPEDSYLLSPEVLRQTLEPNKNVKALILCHPSNPTGGVYSKEDILALGDVLKDFPQVTIIADEIYERLVYDGTECPCIAQLLPDVSVVTINGFSKAYAMTGFRLGYLAGPTDIAKAVTTLQGQLTSCASSIAQAAGVAALEASNDGWVDDRVKELQDKRDFVVQSLRSMPRVKLPGIPKGAFYVLPDISAYCGSDDTQFCVELLQRQKLAIVPGSSFGAPGTIRLSYATSMDELTTAMDKLSSFLSEERDRLGLD